MNYKRLKSTKEDSIQLDLRVLRNILFYFVLHFVICNAAKPELSGSYVC